MSDAGRPVVVRRGRVERRCRRGPVGDPAQVRDRRRGHGCPSCRRTRTRCSRSRRRRSSGRTALIDRWRRSAGSTPGAAVDRPRWSRPVSASRAAVDLRARVVVDVVGLRRSRVEPPDRVAPGGDGLGPQGLDRASSPASPPARRPAGSRRGRARLTTLAELGRGTTLSGAAVGVVARRAGTSSWRRVPGSAGRTTTVVENAPAYSGVVAVGGEDLELAPGPSSSWTRRPRRGAPDARPRRRPGRSRRGRRWSRARRGRGSRAGRSAAAG